MLRENGVVVFDDCRKANTMGVASAMREAILNTEFKFHATSGDSAA